MLRTGPTVALVLCAALISGATMGTHATAASTGSVSGKVTDERGRAVNGAALSLSGDGAVGALSTSTDRLGFYRFPAVPLREPLRVRAEAPGILPVEYHGILAREGSGTRRDFVLRGAGGRDWLIAIDPRIPYHAAARDAIVAALQPSPRVLELRGLEKEDARLLREAVASLPSAILAIGDGPARLAQRWVKDVPVVYSMVVDPVEQDLTTANLCGVRLNAGFGEQLDVLLAARPWAREVGTVFDPRTLDGTLGALRDAAAKRGLTIVARTARSPRDVPGALASLAEEPLDAFLLLLDPLLIDAGAFASIRTFAREESLVLMVPDRSLVAVGGTFSYAPGFAAMGTQAAHIAQLVVGGALTPGQIGSVYPTTRYLSLNPVEAERLGIALAPELLLPSSEPDEVEGRGAPDGVETP